MIKYTGYAKTITAGEARARFAAKHGQPPFEVIDGGAIWFVGPIGGEPMGGQLSLIQRVTTASRPMTSAEARQLALGL
jgi:hypothetical protein